MHTKEEILATLRATPELLRLATAPIYEDFARRRPAPSRWSIVEIVAHLNDVDEDVNQIRVTLMLREDMPILERYDQEAESLRKKFIERKLSSELSRFADIRRKSISSLEKVAPGDWLRKSVHAEYGEISISDLLNEWALHDLDHVRQVLEIRRARLWPHIGGFRRYYKVNP